MVVEGFELELCSPRVVASGASAVWIIECHTEPIVRSLKERFASTHEVREAANSPRSAADLPPSMPFGRLLLPHDRWRLVQEGRPFPTPWLVCTPRANGMEHHEVVRDPS